MGAAASSKARAVADLGAGQILATVEIAAPAERVFRALTAAEDITKWWGAPEAYRTTEWNADVRPGGRWRAAGVGADGRPFQVEGEFREVSPPHKIVQTWRAEWDGSHETVLTYRLEAIDGGTRLTLRHEGFGDRVDSCGAHAKGWESVLRWLDGFLSPPIAPLYFVLRLFAPRPTFAFDMDAAEAEVMRLHAQYWRGLLERGVAIIFGPVADPAGPWGLGVVRAPNEEEVHSLRDRDPAMRSGRGFRCEILPMIRAVL